MGLFVAANNSSQPNGAPNVPENTDTSLELEDADKTKWRWRQGAIYTAYANMIVGVCGIIFFIVAAMVAAYCSVTNKCEDLDSEFDFLNFKPKDENSFLGSGFLLLALCAIEAAPDIFTGHMLLKAMTKEGDVQKCLAKCKAWKNVNMLLILLSGTMVPGGYKKPYVYLWMFYRLSCLVTVCLHIKELQIKSDEMKLESPTDTAQSVA